MSMIEQATKRLEELRRGGVDVPWTAAGLSEARFDEMIGKSAAPAPVPEPQGASAPADSKTALPAAAARRLSEELATKSAAQPRELARTPAKARRSASVTLDLDRLQRSGYLVPSMLRSDLAMEFRQIKRPLLRNAARVGEEDTRNTLIMVTGALPGEGKTFCAVNLAMSMAMEVDTSVLLVDADVIRPSVLDRLGLPPAPGFLDVLTDSKLDLADVMLRTNVPKLSILPAGSRNAMATELLASGAMDRLLMELATRYSDRIVILDSPPLLITTEARVLASRVGQVVVVVDSSRTTTTQVAEAFATVEQCPLVMSVLNKCAEPAHKRGYDYGYGYDQP